MNTRTKAKTVFVTDASQRKAIPIVRSLSKKGIKVLAGDCTRWSPVFHSKYCTKKYIYPDPNKTPALFVDWLITHAKRGIFDVLFPIDEITMTPVTQNLEELSTYMLVPVIDYATYMQARDKSQSIFAAQECGIPCPKTLFPNAQSEVAILAGHFSGTIVIKPRISSGSRGIVYLKDTDRLESEYRKVHAKYPYPMLQEFIPPGGDTYGVGVLMNKESEPRAAFVHRRLREYPISGGPSTLRESVIMPDLVDVSIKLLKALGWYGVAMVEFKVDPRSGTPVFMEVNPKFWGSIALSIVSGVDFPYLLYQMAVNDDIVPVLNYRKNVRCRWLIPGDILHFLSNPKRLKLEPSFFQFRAENLHYDIIDRNDLAPLWGGVLSLISQFRKRDFRNDLFFRG